MYTELSFFETNWAELKNSQIFLQIKILWHHNYHTRSATKRVLCIPCFSPNFYCLQSAKYHCIIDWNNFKKQFPMVTPLECIHSATKSLLKEHFFSQYYGFIQVILMSLRRLKKVNLFTFYSWLFAKVLLCDEFVFLFF